MRRLSLFVLALIMALSSFSLGVSLSYDANPFADDETEVAEGTEEEGEEEEKEPVENFTVEGVMYHVTAEDVVEVEGAEADATSIVIPKEVEYEEVTYKVTTIIEKAFSKNVTLAKVEVSEGVEKIGDSAFESCSRLESVIIPKSVKELGQSLFSGCDRLAKVEIGCDVKEIDKNLFSNCTGLETLELKGDIGKIAESVFEGHKKLKSVTFEGNIDEIGKNAFKDCISLDTFDLNQRKTVKKMGESAFEGCTSLKKFFIPGSVEVIEKSTFKGCEKLVDLEIETGVKEIGESAFEGCSSLEKVTIPSTVKRVGEMAFKDCAKLTTVELDEGVEEIGDSAFVGCGELKMVTIPASVKEIGESVFEGSSLEELTIPASMKVIKTSAFKNSEKLKKVKMEDGVEEIGDSAFVGCIGLGELEFSQTLKKIGESAFSGCNALTEIVIPDKVEEIGEAAFKDCEKVDSLQLGESLAKIGESAFEGCKVLPSVILPEGLTSIEKAAFKDCDSLKWVQVEFKEPFDIELSVFEGIHQESVLKVPKGSRAAFMMKDGWAEHFAKIVGGEYKVTIVATGDGEAICKQDSLLPAPVDSLLSDTLLVRSESMELTFMEGDSVMVAFMSDKGYQIMDVTVNDMVITDSLFADIYAADTLTTEKPRFGEYTIAYLDQDFTVAVAYERIHYRLVVTAIGKGRVIFQDEAVEDTTATFRIEDGLDAFITFSPEDKWRIKSVTVDSLDITSELGKYQYSIKNIKKNTTLVAEYEEIPINKFILTVYVSGQGEVAVDDQTVIRDDSWSAFFNEDTTAVLTFRPDTGYETKYLRVNGTDVTTAIADNQYTISGIRADINVNVSFAAVDMNFEKDGISYQVSSFTDRQVTITSADQTTRVMEVPATVSYMDNNWQVAGIKENALSNCTDLTAVIWNPSVPFKAIVDNPNFLLYVSNAKYVAWADQNAVVDGKAQTITLTDAKSGNDFYCPRAFTAEKISYTHTYSMETGITEAKGWETIALPYDVQTISHSSAGKIIPFKSWTAESEEKPFWLYELSSGGYQEAEGIKANTPYLISMPNNSLYLNEYRIVGKITFASENVEVKASNDLRSVKYSDRTFVPNFSNQSDESILALNVNNDIVTYSAADKGSQFVKGLRAVHPFEAYMTTTSNTRAINVLDGMTTSIKAVNRMTDETAQAVNVYDVRGVLVKRYASVTELGNGLKPGVYVVQGKKMIIK